MLQRYANIIKHLDVLSAAVPRRFQPGLMALEQFASDPAAIVEPEGGVAEDVIRFTLIGSFLACETVSITAVTNRNTRVGPVQLVPAANGQPAPIPPDTFLSEEDLLSFLLRERQGSSVPMQGSLALPATMNRADIVGFEITRSWNTLRYTLVSPVVSLLTSIEGIFGASGSAALQDAIGEPTGRTTVTLTASDLEPAIGGPSVSFFGASIEELDASGNQLPDPPNETYANDTLSGTVLPPQPFPVPALQIAPVLRYNEILEIEKAAQHVVRNTTLYSKAVWLSLTPDERAILLDGYTIGVPSDGISDPSQLVPLLNCVQNKLLGFFGNSMIMPFMIPQGVTDRVRIDPAQIQQGLLAYQQATFTPPQSTIALPTQGVLGEGVLGHCPSAEKIDLTRFWNWQDSPADTAPAIAPVAAADHGPVDRGRADRAQLADQPAIADQQRAAGAGAEHRPAAVAGRRRGRPEGLQHRADRRGPARPAGQQRAEPGQLRQGAGAAGHPGAEQPGHGHRGRHRRRHVRKPERGVECGQGRRRAARARRHRRRPRRRRPPPRATAAAPPPARTGRRPTGPERSADGSCPVDAAASLPVTAADRSEETRRNGTAR